MAGANGNGNNGNRNGRRTSKNGRQNLVLTRQINSMIDRALLRRAEKKFYTSAANGNAAVAGTVWAMSQGIIQGDSVLTRDGSQITVQEIGLKLDVFCAAVAAGVRVILFSDKMNLGVLPLVTDVLSTSTLTSPYSLAQNLTNRFTILADTVRNFTTGGIQQSVINIQRQFRSKLTYNGAADVAASNGKNAIFFLILCDVAVNVPSYDFAFHIRYLDM